MSAALGRVGWRGQDTAAEVERERRRRGGMKRGRSKRPNRSDVAGGTWRDKDRLKEEN